MQIEQLSSTFILELRPLLLLLSGSLCVFSLLPRLPLPLSPWNTSYCLQRGQREGLHTIWNGFYPLIRWSVLRILFKSRQNSLRLSLSCQEAAVLWRGGMAWDSLAQGWVLKRAHGGGWGLDPGSLRSQEKQVMQLMEEPEERCRDLQKASFNFCGRTEG